MTGELRGAVRHARWRWSGAPLLVVGLVLFFWALQRWGAGGSGWTVLLAVLGTGLGLASFGANHDTALALALRAGPEGLPPALRRELDEELARDRDGTLDLVPAPRVALVLPFIAAAVQALVVARLLG